MLVNPTAMLIIGLSSQHGFAKKPGPISAAIS